MELKLNIYNDKDEIIKTYRRESYSIRMRLLKDIIETLDLDNLTKALNGKTTEENIALVDIIAKFVTNAYGTVQDLMLRVFPEMTQEEFLDTNVNEVINVVKNLVLYSISTISLAGGSTKN